MIAQSPLEKLRASARAGAVLAAIGLGFSLPISTALDGLLLALVLALWLASVPRWSEIRRLRHNPAAMASLGLFALCALGLLYGEGARDDGLMYLKKYVDLALVPVFVLLFQEARARAAAIRAFEIAMLATLALSYLLAAGALPWAPPFTANPLSGATVFKLQITHGTFMAFAAFLFAERAQSTQSAGKRLLWSAACALAAANVLTMTIGRTGYLVLFALAALFCWRHFGARGRALAAALALAVVALGVSVPGQFADRVQQTIDEARAWEYGATETSVGHRLNFYVTSLRIIREHPLFGTGLGGYPRAYAAQSAGSGIDVTHNPHNQYLLFAAQLGAAGLAAFLGLLLTLALGTRRIAPGLERVLAQGLVAIVAVSSLANSYLLDHAEGLFFAWLAGLAYATLNSSTEGAAR
jgi:O-antigen ligase